MTTLTILWEAPTGLKTVKVAPGKEYYIGRPRTPQLEKYPWVEPLGVYIIPLDGSPPIATEYTKATVSRYHAKLTIKPSCTVRIKNHGPEGKGALNPTYVNDHLLPPGKAIDYKLRPGQAIQLILTSTGPTFTIMCPQNGRATLTLQADAITRVPKTIARALQDENLVKQSLDHGGEMIIVPRTPGRQYTKSISIGKGQVLDIVIKQEPDKNKIMKANLTYTIVLLKDIALRLERLGRKVAILEIDKSFSARNSINEVWSQLELPEIVKLIHTLGQDAVHNYNQIKYMIKREEIRIETFLKLVEQLTAIIEAKLRELGYKTLTQ